MMLAMTTTPLLPPDLPTLGLPPTSAAVMDRLGVNRVQVDKLTAAGLLRVAGTHGRTPFYDRHDLDALERRPYADPGDDVGIVVHVGGPVPDPDPVGNDRPHVGWHAAGVSQNRATDLLGITCWWNVGTRLAAALVGGIFLADVSSFIVEAQRITGWDEHPTRPGFIRFHVADLAPEVAGRYLGTRITPAPGAPWQHLTRPTPAQVAR